MERPFYVSNRCRYGATEKNRFFPVMTIFKKGRHFKPEVDYFILMLVPLNVVFLT